MLDLVLKTHPSHPHVRRLWRLPAQHDVIVSPGGTHVEQSPVQAERWIRLNCRVERFRSLTSPQGLIHVKETPWTSGHLDVASTCDCLAKCPIMFTLVYLVTAEQLTHRCLGRRTWPRRRGRFGRPSGAGPCRWSRWSCGSC